MLSHLWKSPPVLKKGLEMLPRTVALNAELEALMMMEDLITTWHCYHILGCLLALINHNDVTKHKHYEADDHFTVEDRCRNSRVQGAAPCTDSLPGLCIQVSRVRQLIFILVNSD